MWTDSLPGISTAQDTDTSSPTGRPSVEHYVKKIFQVSDNDAFNRLYELLGQEAFNSALHNKGYPDARIVHRLSMPLTPEQNRQTNGIRFYLPGTQKPLLVQPRFITRARAGNALQRTRTGGESALCGRQPRERAVRLLHEEQDPPGRPPSYPPKHNFS